MAKASSKATPGTTASTYHTPPTPSSRGTEVQEAFTAHLDSLFTMELDDHYFEKTEDISRDGIIGNYVHGNEPGHHIAYLYNAAGRPDRTQEQVRMICETMYGPDVNGLWHDDVGMMSAVPVQRARLLSHRSRLRLV